MSFVFHDIDLMWKNVKGGAGEEDDTMGRSAENEHYLQPLSLILQHLVTF